MNTDEFIKFFRKKSSLRLSEEKCLGCYEDVNWIVYLQICLEEAGISLDKFCDTPMHRVWGDIKQSPEISFRIEKNRLLLGRTGIKYIAGHKFASIGSIRSMLEQILDN